MRLDRVCIDGFKNLKGLELDFDERQLTTVLIGQNGAGKSNLIEALVQVFHWVDLRDRPPRFRFTVDYRIQPRKAKPGELAKVSLVSEKLGQLVIKVDGRAVTRSEFEANKSEWFPDMVFGYYSGSGRRLEQLFDKHQQRYYKAIAREEDEAACWQALTQRRLFYCRPNHAVFALLAQFAWLDKSTEELLAELLKIKGFHSALCELKQPWFDKSSKAKSLGRADNFWGAMGVAGRTAHKLKELAFHPFEFVGNEVTDYRDKVRPEARYGVFLPGRESLDGLRKRFSDDADLFYALEAMDVSDLIGNFPLWVERERDSSGDIEFSDLSDGERQLLMVMGLIRITKGKRVLFLLDEPDTHLNPHWQHRYLRLIEQWTNITAYEDNCHIVLTSHNPLTISALTRNEVRVITQEADGRVTAAPPYADPKGMGFTATLTEIFGLATSLDVETQRQVDERNELAHKEELTDQEALRLAELNAALAKLGFLFDSREPLYKDFLRSWHDLRYADRPALTAEQALARRNAMKTLLQQLMNKEVER